MENVGARMATHRARGVSSTRTAARNLLLAPRLTAVRTSGTTAHPQPRWSGESIHYRHTQPFANKLSLRGRSKM
eukprot:5915907-Pyramimonas_sp.AAC.1